MQLLDLWEFTLKLAERTPAYQLPEARKRTESQKQNLPGAIEELKQTLMGMPGSYRDEYYRQQIEGKDFLQPVAPNCPIDGHTHRRNEICRGCQDLTGWEPPTQSS
jgi:hypothetical protein